MSQIQDFQTPSVAQNEVQFEDEMSDRYGILVGGMKVLQWNGIGENSIGHHLINRRVWLPFVRLQVGRRNEFDGALDMPLNAVQADWATNPDRLRWKSPRSCAADFLHMFKPQGACVPHSLIGHPNPQSLTEKVWPREIREKFRLYQHVEYFEGFKTNDSAEATLASELLEACYASLNHAREYVRMVKTETEGEKGLRNINEELKELFYEVNEPLPEQKTALVAQAMGREIVGAITPDGRKDDAMIQALQGIAAQMQSANARLDRIESGTPLVAESKDSTTEEASGNQEIVPQTSNTQPRRRSVMTK